MIVSILKEICAARGIELTGFSNDWIFLLRRGGRSTYVFGYDFSLNSATAKIICKDKSATSDLLGFHGVPRIEHRIFHGPQLTGYVPLEGNWHPMLGYFEACGRDVVCKPNEGSGGRGVLRARTPAELEAAVVHVFEHNRSLCLSPYERIVGEYRVAVLRGAVQFVYGKERPMLVGDGHRNVRELLLERLKAAGNFVSEIDGLAQAAKAGLDDAQVPAAGEEVVLNWRHNLAQGSVPNILDPHAPEVRAACDLALHAARVLEVAVASVDVVLTPAGPKVLEINAGIMMESLARNLPEGRRLARRFYDRIICAALEIEDEAPP
ncbi:MAG: RimK-like protein [Verrucomicrobia bacterium]|nr:RimK-like protein [Verrucomicrobiota bacterium]